MVRSPIVDAGFLVALLCRRDSHQKWALTQAYGAAGLSALLNRRAVVAAFDLDSNVEPVLKLLQKYKDVPMSLADAFLVRMTETLTGPVILKTDSYFLIYRRHSRQIVPCVMPS